MNSNGKLGILFALALLAEVVGVTLLAGPFGSSLANFTWNNWLVGWGVICAAMLLSPWALRWLGGPKPFRLFSRGTSYKVSQALYLGLLLGIIIAAYKAVLCLELRIHGIPFDSFLRAWQAWDSDEAFLPYIVLSLSGAYFTFGYLQGLMARVFGERGGMIAAALLFALGNVWPLHHFAGDIAGVPRWVVLAALSFPIGIALAYLGARAKSVLPVLAAVLVISWLSGITAAVHSTLGAIATILVMVIMVLVGAEVLIGERRRAKRFIAGFFKDTFARGEGRLLDAVIFILAAAGLFYAARSSEIFYKEWYIFLTIPAALVIISGILWLIYSIIRKRRLESTSDVNPKPPASAGGDSPATR